jgi:hypothetical protein
MGDYLFKKDALITLYPKYEETDDLYPIIINKNGFGTYYDAWFEFQPELDELSIRFHMDDWICEDDDFLDREKLAEELRKRGFRVKIE